MAHFSSGSGLIQAGEGHTLVLPATWKRDASKPLVLAVHGIFTVYPNTPGITSAMPGGAFYALLSAIADAGYPCLSIDGGGIANLGNTASLTAITNAISWAQNASGTYPAPRVKSGKVVGLGYSQGGLELMNHAIRNLTQYSSLVLISGAMDVDDIYDNSRYPKAYFDAAYNASAVPKGDWNATSAYVINDTVVVGSATAYKCTTGNTNSTPPSANWSAITAGAGGPWKTNGSGASPSFNPHKVAQATLAQLPPTQLWGSANDAVCTKATQTFMAGQIGAQAQNLEIPGSPAHNVATLGVPAPSVISFIAANS